MAIRKTYTPEMIENGRRRYEESDEPVTSIVIDFGVHRKTFYKLIARWGWKRRKDRPPHGLSPVMRLLEEARHVQPRKKASQQSLPAPATPETLADAGGDPTSAASAISTDALVDRLERAAAMELAAVEAMRTHASGVHTPTDAERTARTLESLTRTLREVQRLRGAAALPAGVDEDDMPRDIDEFRHELARRIDAFVKSRTDADPHADDEPAGGDPPQP